MEIVLTGFSVTLLVIGLVAGTITEANHFANLKRREAEMAAIVLTNLKRPAIDGPVVDSRLVSGHVVISTDYFKSLCASIRRLVGGPIRSYESLMERGRREALLRLKADAAAMGAHLVLNVRLVTMTVARTKTGNGITGVEILAYGTAVRTGAALRSQAS